MCIRDRFNAEGLSLPVTYAAAGPPPPGLSPLAYAYAAALSPVLFANAARAGDGSRRIAAASAKEF